MKNNTESVVLDEFEHWIGDSEDANWTEYSAQLAAKTTLYRFSDNDWTLLKQKAVNKPEYWQQRCVCALGHDRTESSITTIKKILKNTPYRDVKILAIYELDWADTTIEQAYEHIIREVIQSLPDGEIESELINLLAKAEYSII